MTTGHEIDALDALPHDVTPAKASRGPRAVLHGSHPLLLVSVFSIAIFLNAALLFSVQPLFTKMVLPLLGGTPAVWNTCLLFFQAVLLAGYLYAHLTSRWLSVRAQAVLHMGLLVVALAFLPIAVPASWAPPGTTLPMGWLLGLLTVALGLPFFLLSAGAPMLQRWFAGTQHPHAHNPYFLYAASNLGSFAALLAYPFVIEPRMRISEQSVAWLRTYYGLLVIIGICAVAAFASRRPSMPKPRSDREPAADPPPNPRARARWVLLSFAPSSLLIGVTTYLSTDIASVPFLWVVPLALYLLTFVLVFARRPFLSRELVMHAQLLLGLVLVVALCLPSEAGIIGPATLHLLAFFATALMCHGQLADSRPGAEHLTEYYLWMSFGGMLGGVFNVLVAPILFDSVLEYAIALVIAFALRPSVATTAPAPRARAGDVLYPLVVGVVILAVLRSPRPPSEWFEHGTPLFLVAAMFVVFFFWKRPIRLALGAGAMYAATQLAGDTRSELLMQDRSFFGTYRVRRVDDYHLLLHGTTNHGGQSVDPARRTEPMTYYYRGGAVEDLFTHLVPTASRRVAIVGLGTGAIACYGRPGERWTFYEIDPLVERIAREPAYFTYLRDCPPQTDVVIGDARLRLAAAPDAEYDLIVLDAFSSDAVPVHLMTREAVALYLSKLRPGGALIVHISNRYVDLEPVLIALAGDAGLAGAFGDRSPPDETSGKPYNGSRWVVLAREASGLATLAQAPGWRALQPTSSARLWTDDYTDVLGAIRW